MAADNRFAAASTGTGTPLPARAQAGLLAHLDAAYGLARSLVDDPWLAEDIVHQAYQTALQRMDRAPEDEPGKPWLLAIVHGTAHDWLARHRPQAAGAAPEGPPGPRVPHRQDTDPMDTLRLLKPGRTQLNAALARMDLPLREALVLHEVEALSPAQMARVLAIAENEVLDRLARGHHQLAQLLRDGDRQPEHER